MPDRVAVRLQLLGPFQLYVGAKKSVLSARKARGLLAYLAVRLDEDVPRDTLAGLLWGDSSTDQSRANLRQCLSALRKALGGAADKTLVSSNDSVRLVGTQIVLDRQDLKSLPEEATLAVCKAIADRYRGDFLEGFDTDAPEFDYWLTAERAVVRTQISALYRRLIALCEADRRPEEAIRYASQLLALDPLQEDVHRALIRLYSAQGRHDAALKQFEQCRRELSDQLGVLPEQETLDLVKEVRSLRRTAAIPVDPAPKEQAAPAKEGIAAMIGLDISIPDYPSIAVMPFVAMSEEAGAAFFAQGISDDITTALAKIDGLLVIAQSSVFAYDGKAVAADRVGREQGVRYVLEGNLRQVGDQVRVSARLIDTRAGRNIWAESFDRKLQEVFAVQDEISREIITAMDVRLREGAQHRIWSSGTKNFKAWEALRLATGAILGGEKVAQKRAHELIDEALELDPEYANAWAMRARLYCNQADVGGGIASESQFAEAQSEAFRSGHRALEIDPDCAEAHAALALIHLNAGEHDKAIAMTEAAIALAPNNAETLGGVASAVMRKSGYPERGAEYVRKAMRLCPVFRPGLLRALGNCLRLTGQLEEAAALYRESLKREPGYLAANVNFASVLGELGQLAEAGPVVAEILRLEPKFSIEGYTRRLAYARASDTARIAQGLRAAGLPETYRDPRAKSPSERPTIAVLPFANLSGDPSQDLFSDGISADIITELSRFRTLSVVARYSSFAFRNADIDLKEIGEKLGVQYIVEGSVRRGGAMVRVTVQLIEVATGVSLWAERYDRELDDVFAVQDEVTRSIVAVLPGRVQDRVALQASKTPTRNLLAYEYMLQGKHLRDGLNAEDTAKAREVLEKALALDPDYARAYMYLADTYVVDIWLGLADADASQKSLSLSRKGAGLDNSDVYIQDQLGFAFLCEGLWEDAEAQFDHTLSRIVNEAESMAWCGYAFLLLGHHKKALGIIGEAMRLDPLHAPTLDWILGQALFFNRDFNGAVGPLIGEALLNSLAHAFLASSYAHLGKLDEAQKALAGFIALRRHEFASRNIAVGEETIGNLAGAYKAMWRRSEDWDLLAEGLRMAGLPD